MTNTARTIAADTMSRAAGNGDAMTTLSNGVDVCVGIHDDGRVSLVVFDSLADVHSEMFTTPAECEARLVEMIPEWEAL